MKTKTDHIALWCLFIPALVPLVGVIVAIVIYSPF